MLAIIGLVMPGIIALLNKVIPDPTVAAKAAVDIQTALIAQQTALDASMTQVMQGDSASASKYTANARPTVVYWSLVMISVIAFLGIFHAASPVIDALAAVPGKLWDLITFGIGAFAIGRSVEKTAGAVTTAVLNRRVK